MAVARQLGYGIDCALGAGVYQKDFGSQHGNSAHLENVTARYLRRALKRGMIVLLASLSPS
jgi:hypothetical protein